MRLLRRWEDFTTNGGISGIPHVVADTVLFLQAIPKKGFRAWLTRPEAKDPIASLQVKSREKTFAARTQAAPIEVWKKCPSRTKKLCLQSGKKGTGPRRKVRDIHAIVPNLP